MIWECDEKTTEAVAWAVKELHANVPGCKNAPEFHELCVLLGALYSTYQITKTEKFNPTGLLLTGVHAK